ncbi:uncharacterized protein N7479_001211 [Penicillium vulpinum]|uniref:uncharacterized protein n=1 Tax=Penicillium vulpinum TaxID=29845 RepID=UPI00254856F6|nr:uncharacterized protein N7479_001211 [Penicillium vulpinum]KAJ5971293.1 hypothetical protein N7479_001211 [Penicillium vulpinum]
MSNSSSEVSTTIAELAIAIPPPTADERYLQSLIYGLIISTGILSMVVCSLRLYTRAFIVNVFGVDDIAVCIALVFTQTFNGVGIAIVYYGEGLHFTSVSPESREMWLKVALTQLLLAEYIADLGIALLRRDVPVPLHLVSSEDQLAGIFTTDLRETASYDLSVKNPTCFTQYKLFQITLYQAVLIFVCDVIILLAPMAILCRLQMPTRKIIALVAIFGSGIIACISPVVRFSTLDYLRNGTTDLTYDSASSLYWMAIEFNLGLVAGSLSSLRPLPLFCRFGSSTNAGDKASNSDESHELRNVKGNEPAAAKKNRISFGMGTTILQDSVNESQERIIHAKGDYNVKTHVMSC